MPPKAQPPAVAPDAGQQKESEIESALEAPANTEGAAPESAADGNMTTVPLEQGGTTPQARDFQAAGEPGTSQDRALPDMGKAGKGIWGRLKKFLQKEAIRLLCGDQFLKPKRRRNNDHHGHTNHHVNHNNHGHHNNSHHHNGR